MNKRVVLIGAGHAHLYIAKRAEQYKKFGAELILIDPGQFWYSGLATGMLGAEFDAQDDQVDPRQLIESSGGTFIQTKVKSVDTTKQTVELDNGTCIAYDCLSLNIGSEIGGDAGIEITSQLAKHADQSKNTIQIWRAKPIAELYQLRQFVEQHVHTHHQCPEITVVGGGITGTELAANLIGLAESLSVEPKITLICSTSRLMPSKAKVLFYKRLADKIARLLTDRGLNILFNTRFNSNDLDGVNSSHVLLATGLRGKQLDLTPSKMCGESLKRHKNPHANSHASQRAKQNVSQCTASDGFAVNQYLQVIDHDKLFAVGDCAYFTPQPLPKVGVFGVRAAPVLHHNLLGVLTNANLKPFRPQRVWLAILNLGNQQGLLMWWRFWWIGRFSHKLKYALDKKFLKQYRID